MSGKYKRSMDEIHAPQDLIDRTKREVSRAETDRKIIAFPQWKTITAAAAALVLVVSCALFWSSLQGPVFTVLTSEAQQQMPEEKFGLIHPEKRNVNAAEFDEAFGTGLTELETEDFSAWLTRSIDGEAETGEASFSYQDMQVRVGKGENLLPEELTNTQPQKISGAEVYLAQRGENGPLLAGFVKNGLEWFVTAGDMDQQNFISAVTVLAGSGKEEIK